MPDAADKTRPRPSAASSSKAPSIPWSTRNSSDTASSGPPKPSASPSPSASVILVAPTNEVLLLHRVQTSSAFPSAHVFPGGNAEPSDGDMSSEDSNPKRHQDNLAYRTCAIRELFEESGILLARQSSDVHAPLLSVPLSSRLEGRNSVHKGSVSIHDWLKSQSPSAVLDTESLLPFTRWITPPNIPKRFTTQMYLYFLPASIEGDSSFTATGDEVETMAPEWLPAKLWIDRARKGEIILFPPQFLLLSFVSQFLDVNAAGKPLSREENGRQREELVKFVTEDGSPPWTEKVICPKAIMMRKDGRTILDLNDPGPELRNSNDLRGDSTRAVLVRFSKEGPREVEVRSKKELMDETKREQERDSKL